MDSEGNGHLPYKDAEGNIDLPHLSDALARLDQVQGMSDSERASVRAKLEKELAESKDKNSVDNLERLTLSATSIKLDASGELPTRLPLFTTFDHPNSVKGHLAVNVDDLRQMKEHFDAGIGFPTEDASTGLPIDFEHKFTGKAAGWIKGLELSIDPNDPKKATLYADPVEWSDEGAAAVKNGRYKMVSPMGGFGTRDGKPTLWANVNNLKERLANVLEGAGLTNIPFQRSMSPIRAAAIADDDIEDDATADGIVLTSDTKQIKETSMLNIDEVRVKERDTLSIAELDFLIEQREKLSADELKRFKLDAAPADPALSAEDKVLLDAVKSGSKKVVDATSEVVEKTRLDALEKAALDYRTEKAESLVDGHVKRGAIKMDSRDYWTKQLLDATPENREALEKQLASLPDNELLSKEIGNGQEVDNDVEEDLKRKTLAVQKEAKENNEMLTYAQAQDRVLRDDADIKARVEAAREGK